MDKIVNYLTKLYDGNDDFVMRNIPISEDETIYLFYFESLCESSLINEYIIQNISEFTLFDRKIRSVLEVVSGPKIKSIDNKKDITYYLENGFSIVIFDKEIYAVETRASIDRGITMSQTEPTMYGSKDSFCENYQKNLGVLKRRIKSSDLVVKSIDSSKCTKTKISVIYLDSLVDREELKKVLKSVDRLKSIDINDSYDVAKELKLNKVFPTILKSEKPGLVSRYILDGYITIMIDNTPFMLILDAKLKDFVNPFTTDKFVKFLRYACLFLTILTPALYIALINFNQEAIPIQLLVNFTEQRDTVPFPAVIEATIMLSICEVLREADIKYPNSYGSAASILGALVLGEAAVSAGLVSAIMIIIVAITFITNLIFTEIKLVWAIRILRFSFLLIASLFGLYGISIAIIICVTCLANVRMYGGEYI